MLTFAVRSCPGGALLAAVIAATAAPALAQCPATFTVGPAWTMGSPFSVSVGDFNLDGRMDFAGANFSGSDVTVRLADPNTANNYLNASSYPLGANPRGSGVADFNHDGRPDLAVVYNGGGPANTRLAILISNGNGTFQAPVLYPVASQPYDVELADVNHDGNIDVLATCACGSISILLGNANGTFQPYVSVAPGVEPSGLAVTDVNGDGTLDLVTTRYSDPPQVRVSLGIPGSGGLGYSAYAAYTVPNNWGPWGIEPGDFNGDGRGDVAVTHRVSGSVGVLLGNANGSLTPMPIAGANSWPQDVAVADFNGDGKLDVAVGNWGPGNGVVSVLLGNGQGGLSARSNFTCGQSLNGVRAADMNNDGKPDIVVANQGSGTVQILYNTTPVTVFPLQPFPQRVCPGGMSSATFMARGTTTQAGGVTGYRWERLNNGTWQTLVAGPLAGVGTISFGGGTNGDPTSLSVANVEGNAGDTVMRVRAVVLNACGATPSNDVTLSLIRQCGPADIGGPGGLPSPCGDGYLDNNDFIAFITYFFNGSAIADFGQAGGFAGADGRLNNNDFVAFINAFFAGCP